MLTSTTNDIAGQKIVRHIGVVRGITVRSRNVLSDALGGLQSVLGGRVGAYVKLAEMSRQEAFEQLIEHAEAAGANAILALRYESNEIMPGITEVLAYGTAVVVEPQA